LGAAVTSKTQIVNIALMRMGVSQSVANVDTENSREALSARLIFNDERDFVLRDFPWPFATAYAELGLGSGSATSPANRDWTFAYRYPSDCMFARRLVTENGRNDTNPPPFRLGRDAQGRLIFTNEQDAQLEYTASVTDAGEFDPLFVSMLAWRLAASMAPSLSRLKDMAKTALEMYAVDKSTAQARALNEQQQEQPAESEFISARS
jgi:hypothetical protein